MKTITVKKQTSNALKGDPRAVQDYINDPYFVKKREIAVAFLREVGLPKSFKKTRAKY